MNPEQRRTLLGMGALALAASIWGGLYVVSKFALAAIPPFTLLFIRYVIAFAVLWLVASRQGILQPLGRDWRTFFTIGLVGNFLSVGLQFVGTRLSSASMGALLTSASPAFIVLFARFMLGEVLSLRKLAAVLLASGGVLVVVGWQPPAATGAVPFLGNLALIGAAVTWALLSVLARKHSAHYPPLLITLYAIFWGAICTIPVMVVEWQLVPFGDLTSLLLWLAVLYIGVVSTAGAFWLWNKGMQLVEAGTGSLLFFLQPVVGALLGWLLLGERLAPSFFIGGLLILTGVLVVSLPLRR